MHSRFMTHMWATWFAGSISTFLIAEFAMLLTGRPQDTLSANIWRMIRLTPGQSVIRWDAAHFLFIGLLILVFAWLIGHFGWGIWR
jgi:hypothetical protein